MTSINYCNANKYFIIVTTLNNNAVTLFNESLVKVTWFYVVYQHGKLAS